MTQYDDKRWIEHSWINKSFVKQLIEKLKHKIGKNNTKYKCGIILSIKVACSLYKLSHVSKYMQWSEFFVTRKLIIHFTKKNS
jgi:hypothetical protein